MALYQEGERVRATHHAATCKKEELRKELGNRKIVEGHVMPWD